MIKSFGAVVPFGIVCSAAFADAPGDTKDADAEFFSGQFAHAQKLYEAVEPTSPSYGLALRQQGAIALYENRLDDADRLLDLAIGKDPQDTKADLLLAEMASRHGD